MSCWTVSHKYDRTGASLADRHYSRRKVGAPQFMPPGEVVVLVRPDAVFGWWRPHPRSGIKAMNGLDGWTCTIFRREGLDAPLASEMILDAERELEGKTCGPSGLLTYVAERKVQSPNPGYCFLQAGYRRIGRAAHRDKWLLWKPWELRGVRASGIRPPNRGAMYSIAPRDQGGRIVSNAAFANATIDHLRGYGIRMHKDEWHALRIYLEAAANELEAWARKDERERSTESPPEGEKP